MQTDTAPLAGRLTAALLAHHAAGGAPKAFDQVARDMVSDALAGGAPPDAIVAAAVALQRLVQDTWEEDTKAACKFRKLYHRAWLRGVLVGAARGGLPPETLAEGLGRATVPVAYEEAIPLGTYAYSIGYGFGQAWAATSRSEPDRQAWLAALISGVDAGETALREAAAYHGEALDPDLVPPDERAAKNVEAGFHLGCLTGFFSK
ncbi:MAG: hypothetical protein FJZ01_23600 [Candidatus Sericytochromatia bacterium]|nr:hypothetical protein [Candidatus Tanganyikabacteria bacterium]